MCVIDDEPRLNACGFVFLRNAPFTGCDYRVELSIDPGFHQVPISPAFALISSCLTTRSKAFLCGRRCALPVRPVGGTFYPLSLATRSSGHFLPDAVSWSPNVIVLLPQFLLVSDSQQAGTCDWVERGNCTPERPA